VATIESILHPGKSLTMQIFASLCLTIICNANGGAENAGHENAGREIAGHENDGQTSNWFGEL